MSPVPLPPCCDHSNSTAPLAPPENTQFESRERSATLVSPSLQGVRRSSQRRSRIQRLIVCNAHISVGFIDVHSGRQSGDLAHILPRHQLWLGRRVAPNDGKPLKCHRRRYPLSNVGVLVDIFAEADDEPFYL